MAKPIKILELHYPMIQFLIIAVIPVISSFEAETRLMGHVPLYCPTSLVCMQAQL